MIDKLIPKAAVFRDGNSSLTSMHAHPTADQQLRAHTGSDKHDTDGTSSRTKISDTSGVNLSDNSTSNVDNEGETSEFRLESDSTSSKYSTTSTNDEQHTKSKSYGPNTNIKRNNTNERLEMLRNRLSENEINLRRTIVRGRSSEDMPDGSVTREPTTISQSNEGGKFDIARLRQQLDEERSKRQAAELKLKDCLNLSSLSDAQQKIADLEQSIRIKDSELIDAKSMINEKNVELELLKLKTEEVLKVGTTIKEMQEKLMLTEEQEAIFENEIELKSSLLEIAREKQNDHEEKIKELTVTLEILQKKHNEMEKSIRICSEQCGVQSIDEIPSLVEEMQIELLQQTNNTHPIDHLVIQEILNGCHTTSLDEIPQKFDRLSTQLNVLQSKIEKKDEELIVYKQQVENCMNQCQVKTLNEIPVKLNQLSTELEEKEMVLHKLKHELADIKADTLDLIRESKLYVIEADAEAEETLLKYNELVTELEEMLYRSVAEHGEMEEKFNELKRQCNCTKLQDIPLKIEDLQVQLRNAIDEKDRAMYTMEQIALHCEVNDVEDVPEKFNELKKLMENPKSGSVIQKPRPLFAKQQDHKLGDDDEMEKFELKNMLAEKENKIAILEENVASLKVTADRVYELGSSVDTLQKAIVRAHDDQKLFEKNISLIHNICKMNRIQVIPEALMELQKKVKEARGRLTSSEEAKDSLTAAEELRMYANETLAEQIQDLQSELARTKEELKRVEAQNQELRQDGSASRETAVINKLINCSTSKEVIETLKAETVRSETKARLLQNEVNKLRVSLEMAQSQIEDLQSNKGRGVCSSFSFDPEGELFNPKNSVKSEMSSAEVQKLQLLLERKTKEIEELNAEIEEQSSQLTNAKNIIENLQDERGYNQAKLYEIETLMNSTLKNDTESQLKEKSVECSRLAAECSVLQQKLTKSEDAKKTLQSEVDKKRELIRRLYQAGEGSNGISGKAFDTFVQKLQNENQRSLDQVADLSLQLAESKSRVETLESEIRKLKFEVQQQKEDKTATIQGGFEVAESMFRNAVKRTASGDWGGLVLGSVRQQSTIGDLGASSVHGFDSLRSGSTMRVVEREPEKRGLLSRALSGDLVDLGFGRPAPTPDNALPTRVTGSAVFVGGGGGREEGKGRDVGGRGALRRTASGDWGNRDLVHRHIAGGDSLAEPRGGGGRDPGGRGALRRTASGDWGNLEHTSRDLAGGSSVLNNRDIRISSQQSNALVPGLGVSRKDSMKQNSIMPQTSSPRRGRKKNALRQSVNDSKLEFAWSRS